MRSWGSPAITEPNGEEAGEAKSEAAGVSSVGKKDKVQTDSGQSKKKKKRKGDKGGTGVNANSKRPKSLVDEGVPMDSTALTHEPAIAASELKTKKRKHQSIAGRSAYNTGDAKPVSGDLEPTNGSITAVMSSKQIRRLRKTMSKLEKATGESTPLVDWLQRVCQSDSSEDMALDSVEVMRGLKVSLMNSKWVLDV